MKLHLGKLYWPTITKVEEIKSNREIDLEKNDILIVGGGISGAISAYRLSKAGYKVTLVEKNEIASGSSAANTGLIQYMSDQGVNYYIEKIGEDEAVNFYNQSVQAVQTLIEINEEVEELESPTFEVKKSLILATEKSKVDEVKKEVETQKELGYGAKYYSEDELKNYKINAFGALCASPDIALNPYGFVHRLIKASVEKFGLHLMENTEFVSIEDRITEQVVTLRKEDKEIKASFKKILFATGYQPPEIFREKLNKLQVNKTFVTVSDKDIDLDKKTDFLIWEVKDPYTYFRHTFDESLMIGGLDEENNTIQEKDVDKNTEELIKLTKEILADKDLAIRPKYSYVALFGESKDDLPYMGIDPDNENLMVICGAGGNGTIYSTIASELALSWVKGEDLSKYEIFSLGR